MKLTVVHLVKFDGGGAEYPYPYFFKASGSHLLVKRKRGRIRCIGLWGGIKHSLSILQGVREEICGACSTVSEWTNALVCMVEEKFLEYTEQDHHVL